jgi:hypothetical protein
MVHVGIAAVLKPVVAWALPIKPKFGPQFIESSVLDKEISNGLMDELNGWLVGCCDFS